MIPAAPDIYKIDALKQIVSQYFDYINNRNWAAIYPLLSYKVENYYGAKNLIYSDVLDKLRAYWDADRRTGILYTASNMIIIPVEHGYRVTVPVVERGTEGFYKTPIWVTANLIVDVGTNDKIFAITSTIREKQFDVYRMFRLDEMISASDLANRNSTSDWSNVLSKIKSVAAETPSELPKYRQAALDLYGPNCRVTIGGYTMYLSEYLRRLANGEETETFFYNIKTNADGGKDLSR